MKNVPFGPKVCWAHPHQKSLLYAVLFCTGKTFCLRGGPQHYALKISQFSFSTEVHNGVQWVTVEYVENGSKNRSGGYKDEAKNKVVKQYADLSVGEQCCVYSLKTYLSKLPQSAFEKDVFYLHLKNKCHCPMMKHGLFKYL